MFAFKHNSYAELESSLEKKKKNPLSLYNKKSTNIYN